MFLGFDYRKFKIKFNKVSSMKGLDILCHTQNVIIKYKTQC